jgi:hypothetical protein
MIAHMHRPEVENTICPACRTMAQFTAHQCAMEDAPVRPRTIVTAVYPMLRLINTVLAAVIKTGRVMIVRLTTMRTTSEVAGQDVLYVTDPTPLTVTAAVTTHIETIWDIAIVTPTGLGMTVQRIPVLAILVAINSEVVPGQILTIVWTASRTRAEICMGIACATQDGPGTSVPSTLENVILNVSGVMDLLIESAKNVPRMHIWTCPGPVCVSRTGCLRIVRLIRATATICVMAAMDLSALTVTTVWHMLVGTVQAGVFVTTTGGQTTAPCSLASVTLCVSAVWVQVRIIAQNV